MRALTICLFLFFYVHKLPAQLVWSQKEIQQKNFQPTLKKIPMVFFIASDTAWQLPPKKQLFIQPNFYTQYMGAICKVELKMQKKLNFPLYFRLGNKEYVDKIEKHSITY
jgi:hypothetical protein